MKKLILTDGRNAKSINPFDFDDHTGWTQLTGPEDDYGIDLLYRRVPWLKRSVKDRGNNVAHMPWVIMAGKDEIATSATWQEDKPRDLTFLDNPRKLLNQIEQSIAVHGMAYLALEVNNYGYIKGMRYLHPKSVIEDLDLITGKLKGYKRSLNGREIYCSIATEKPVQGQVQIVAIYDPDYTTERGPSNSSDALAALTAAGVLYSFDTFVTSYFRRGAIKATILAVENAQLGEQERLQHWWDDVIGGVKNAWSAVVMRAKQVVATVIGEGMEGTADNDLSTQRRQDISTAMGIPESRLWSAAANMATRKEDEAAYFRGTIIPECDLIAEALNEQVFNKIHNLDGYRIEFQPETLDVFQEDEVERAGALGALIDTVVKIPTYELGIEVMNILGYEYSDQFKLALKTYLDGKKPQPVPAALAPFAGQNNQSIVVPSIEPTSTEPASMSAIDQAASVRAMLKNWERKSTYALKQTGKANIGWKTDLLSVAQVEDISELLTACETKEQIKGVFANIQLPDVMPEPVKAIDPILILANELRLAREAITT